MGLLQSGLSHLAAVASAAILGTAGTQAQAQQSADAALMDRLVKAAQAEKSVMVYGTAPIDQISSVYKAFEAKYGVSARNFQATGSPLVTRLANEAAVGQMHADVLTGSETILHDEHPEYFQKLSSANFPNWAEVPEQAKLTSGLGVSYQVTVYSIIYNTNKMSEATRPKTWLEMADPKWKGQAILIDPRASAAYRSVLNILRKAHPDILARMAAQQPRVVEAAIPAVQQLAAGTGTFAYPGSRSNAETLMDKGAPIGTATLEGPELSRRNWVSAVAGPSPNAGRLFTHFMILGEGQAAYCKTNSTASSIMDPDGRKHGCVPLAKDPQFLPENLVSAEDSAVVLKELKLE